MTRQTNFTLRNILAKLYPDDESMRRVMADASLNETLVKLRSSAANNWYVILSEAEKLGKTAALLDVALTDYGTNVQLQEAVAAYRDSLIIDRNDKPSTSIVPTPPSTVSPGAPDQVISLFLTYSRKVADDIRRQGWRMWLASSLLLILVLYYAIGPRLGVRSPIRATIPPVPPQPSAISASPLRPTDTPIPDGATSAQTNVTTQAAINLTLTANSPTVTVLATATNTPQPTDTPTPTLTATSTATNTPVQSTATATVTPLPTDTPTPDKTATVQAHATRQAVADLTLTALSPTLTPTATATETSTVTPLPPTSTPTMTPIPTLIPLKIKRVSPGLLYPAPLHLEGNGPSGATIVISVTDSWQFSPPQTYTTTIDPISNWDLAESVQLTLPGAYTIMASAYLTESLAIVDTAALSITVDNPCAPSRIPDLSERPCIFFADEDNARFDQAENLRYVTIGRICTTDVENLLIKIVYINPSDQFEVELGERSPKGRAGGCALFDEYSKLQIDLNKSKLIEWKIWEKLASQGYIELVAKWPTRGDSTFDRELPFVVRLKPRVNPQP